MSTDYLQSLLRLDRLSADFPDQLGVILNERSFEDYIVGLEPDPLLQLVECLDSALDDLNPDSAAFRRTLRNLRKICASRMLLPRSYILSDHQLRVDHEPFASGGYSDVHKGTLLGSAVCVKGLRVASTSGSEKTRKMLHREVVMWKRLTHQNIVPFKGVTLYPLRIVSEWMPGGDLGEYINRNPEANRVELLVDVARGLNYLHLSGVVHGDLKGPNILFDGSGRAHIADFGLARNQDITYKTSTSQGYTARWAAPEILDGGVANKEADVFAFAMVMVEAFTGTIPFHHQSSVGAMVDIIEGRRPPRPEHSAFTPDLWELMQRCWNQESHSRPEMSEVVQVLLDSNSSKRDFGNTRPSVSILSPDPVQRIHTLDKSSPHLPEQLETILEDNKFRHSAQHLQGESLATLVNDLDSFLDILDPTGPAFSRCQSELKRICGVFGILPESYMVPNTLLITHPQPVASGGFADVYKGTLKGSSVCVKQAQTYLTDDSKRVQKSFYQVAIVWKHLYHPNIVPFQGVTINPLQLISDWMPGGDLLGYIIQHPDADRIKLLDEIVQGLDYLHSRGVVHGDLNGSNVLVDSADHARITDFGFAIVPVERDSTMSASYNHGHAVRWAAPEIINENDTPSKQADVFSLAMVMVEVFTGSVPFDGSPVPAVMVAILEGKRPPRPNHATFTDKLWTLAKRCWDQEPRLRPDVTEVLRVLRGFHLYSKNSSKRPSDLVPAVTPGWESVESVVVHEAYKTHALGSPPNPLEQFLRLDISSPKFHDQVSEVLYGREFERWVQDVKGDDLMRLVDHLDEVLDVLDPASPGSRKCLRELRYICGKGVVLPTSYTVPVQALTIDPYPVASGGYGDVYEGRLNDSKVCVKRVRVYCKEHEVTKDFYREAIVWKRLEHKNIVPFFGITPIPLQLISEWMPNGDVTEYIARNPSVDRLGLATGVAEGLDFLHSRNVVHGDIKGPNILVDAFGNARITDFGLAKVTRNLDSVPSTTGAQGHTARWTAPEILNGGGYSKEADAFSFAMVMIEIFTGAAPFNDTLPIVAVLAIMNGKRPPRPTHPAFTDDLWELTQHCWDGNPELRPEASGILKALSNNDPLPTSFPVHRPGGMETRGNGRKGEHMDSQVAFQHPAFDPNHHHRGEWQGEQNKYIYRRPSQENTTSTSDIEKDMEALSNSTEEKITLIARRQGVQDPRRILQVLTAIFDASDYLLVLRDHPNAQQYIDGLFEIFRTVALEVSMRQRCFRALKKAVGETGFLPTSYQLPYPLKKQDTLPKAAGGFSDVWKATSPSGTTFALKVLRVIQQDDLSEIRKRFCKEVLVAKQVTDPNVLAITGVQMTGDSGLCIVSPWMEHGNLITYLQDNDAECDELLLGVVKGLNYLHSIEVIHGDLKSSNILIDPKGNPRLADFGFSSITKNNFSINASTPHGRGSTRWRAPELLVLSTKAKERERARLAGPTNKSDIYSLAMVMIEIFTGRHPFDSHTDEQVILLLAQGTRPDRPVHRQFSAALWSLTKKCWNKDPGKRPDISEVLRKLEPGAGRGIPSFIIQIICLLTKCIGGNRYKSLAASLSAFFGSRLSHQLVERSNTIQ